MPPSAINWMCGNRMTTPTWLVLTTACGKQFAVWTQFHHKVRSWSLSAADQQRSYRCTLLGRHQALSSLKISSTTVPTALVVCHPVIRQHISTQMKSTILTLLWDLFPQQVTGSNGVFYILQTWTYSTRGAYSTFSTPMYSLCQQF